MEAQVTGVSRKKLAKIFAQCWADANFKKRFIDNPREVLEAEGLIIPEGVKVRVMEDSEKIMTIVIPPASSDMSDIAAVEERIAAVGFIP